MPDTTAPPLIRRYFDLASQPDSDAYFAQFAVDATVEDEGTQHHGIDGIRAWRASVPLVTYTVQPFPADLAIKWFVSGVVQGALVGLLVHWVYKPRQEESPLTI